MAAGLRLVVGLGNPGAGYAHTRHNVGFWVVEALAAKWSLGAARSVRRALVWRARHGKEEVMLALPQTFMNLSGESVGALVRFYKLAPEDLLVVHDELDFPVGTLRFKSGGGHGGHNGLRSISQHIGADYARLRVGIGRPPAGAQGADYVLAPLWGEARGALEAAAGGAAQAVACWLADGLVAATRSLHAPP